MAASVRDYEKSLKIIEIIYNAMEEREKKAFSVFGIDGFRIVTKVDIKSSVLDKIRNFDITVKYYSHVLKRLNLE